MCESSKDIKEVRQLNYIYQNTPRTIKSPDQNSSFTSPIRV